MVFDNPEKGHSVGNSVTGSQYKQDIPQSLEMSGVEEVFNQRNDIEGREGGTGGEEREGET